MISSLCTHMEEENKDGNNKNRRDKTNTKNLRVFSNEKIKLKSARINIFIVQ